MGQETCSCLEDLPCSEAAWVVLEYSAAFGMTVVLGEVAEGEGFVGSSCCSPWVASVACSWEEAAEEVVEAAVKTWEVVLNLVVVQEEVVAG